MEIPGKRSLKMPPIVLIPALMSSEIISLSSCGLKSGPSYAFPSLIWKQGIDESWNSSLLFSGLIDQTEKIFRSRMILQIQLFQKTDIRKWLRASPVTMPLHTEVSVLFPYLHRTISRIISHSDLAGSDIIKRSHLTHWIIESVSLSSHFFPWVNFQEKSWNWTGLGSIQ